MRKICCTGLSSCDNLLILDDEAVIIKSKDNDELLIPSLKTEAKQLQMTTGHFCQIQQTSSNDSVMEDRKRTPECLLSKHMVSGLARYWLVESVEATDKVFSLDRDTGLLGKYTVLWADAMKRWRITCSILSFKQLLSCNSWEDWKSYCNHSGILQSKHLSWLALRHTSFPAF